MGRRIIVRTATTDKTAETTKKTGRKLGSKNKPKLEAETTLAAFEKMPRMETSFTENVIIPEKAKKRGGWPAGKKRTPKMKAKAEKHMAKGYAEASNQDRFDSLVASIVKKEVRRILSTL